MSNGITIEVFTNTGNNYPPVQVIQVEENEQPIIVHTPEYFAPVQSVNGKIGFVTITPEDIGLLSGVVYTTGDQTINGVITFGDSKKIILDSQGLKNTFFLTANSGISIFELLGTENSTEYQLFEGENTPLISGFPKLDIVGNFIISNSPPLTTGDPGIKGSISCDTEYFYVCVENNSWKRVGLNVW